MLGEVVSEGRYQLRKGYLSGDANLRGLVSEGESMVRARVSVGGYQSEWTSVCGGGDSAGREYLRGRLAGLRRNGWRIFEQQV